MTQPKVSVVKRMGSRHSEPYDEKKLRRSIELACGSVKLPEGVARDTSQQVAKAVNSWLANKQEVTSSDIRRIATKTLSIVSPEAAYLYKHYHQML